MPRLSGTVPVLSTVLVALIPLLGGCQTTQVVMNQPLPKAASGTPDYNDGYSLNRMLEDPRGEVLLALAFSGGGKRSAAFAHGALRGLSKMQVREDGKTRRLLDEVDYIAAVSGGSFPAMHYGLYRDKSFDTFTDDFLKRDINAYIYGVYLLPWNWEWLANPYFGTNDHMAEVYDRLMFHGATYADLAAKGLPFISINATDISYGSSFAFTQQTFDLLCSNMDSFPVSRAVAASNGFPVLFSPITLTNYRKRCGNTFPPGMARVAGDTTESELSRRVEALRLAQRYLDAERTQYVHLMDGGIADNVALRALLNNMIVLDNKTEFFGKVAAVTRRIIIISVDGQAAANPSLPHQRIVTGLGQVFSAVSGTQIDAYNFETLLLADGEVKRLVARVKESRCAQASVIQGHDCADVQGALIHISLSDVTDPVARARLQAIPTGLTIPDADVDTLVNYGDQLIREDETLRRLINGLDGTPMAAVRTP